MSDPNVPSDTPQQPEPPAVPAHPAAPDAAAEPAPAAPAPDPQAAYPPAPDPQAAYPQNAYPQAASAQAPYQQAAYPQAEYAQAPYQQPGYVSAYPKNDLAVWSFVLGLAGFVLGCLLVTGIPAVILGRNAQRAVAEGQANNPGLATAGIVLGWVSIGLSVAVLVLLGLTLVFGVIALPFLMVSSSSVG